jgi:hypothetical protein
MYFGTRSISQIRSDDSPSLVEAQEGLREVEKLIDGVNKQPVNDKALHKSEGVAGVAGLFHRTLDRRTNDTVVTGVGRQLGTIYGQDSVAPDKLVTQRGEAYVRSASAVRPISADVARNEAVRLERRLALR